ncbi:SIMPL domain-containing protein [soil metagenome]
MKNTIALLITIIILVALMNMLNLHIPVAVTTTTRSTEMSVIGEGKVEVVPDVAYVDVGITVSQAKTVEAAQNEINTKNNAVLAAMKKLGIDRKNIKTSNYSIYPAYDYDSGKEILTGYSANVTISIKTPKVEQVSDVIAQATAAGANQVQGTRFEVDNPAKYREQSRAEAIANAKEQAQKLANDLGIKLGKVINVAEYTPSTSVMPMYADKAMSMNAAGGNGPAVEPGSETITTVVTLYYEKK